MKELIAKHTIDPLKDILVKRKQTLAVAESVTAGVVQAMCSAATNASMFFQGGVTVYNLGQKAIHLGIEPIHAEQCDCVSADISAQMALGVCNMFRSDWGIAITGYASPTPASHQELFCFCAIAFRGEIAANEKFVPSASEFFAVQVEYARRAIELLQQKLM